MYRLNKTWVVILTTPNSEELYNFNTRQRAYKIFKECVNLIEEVYPENIGVTYNINRKKGNAYFGLIDPCIVIQLVGLEFTWDTTNVINKFKEELRRNKNEIQ